jgi:hypothetical protein
MKRGRLMIAAGVLCLGLPMQANKLGDLFKNTKIGQWNQKNIDANQRKTDFKNHVDANDRTAMQADITKDSSLLNAMLFSEGTALMHLCSKDRSKSSVQTKATIDVLLSYTGSPTIPAINLELAATDNHETALYLLAKYSRGDKNDPEAGHIAAALISKGAIVNSKTKDFKTPLDAAIDNMGGILCRDRNKGLIKTLVDNGAKFYRDL